jgi:hypothetical protein
LGGGGGGQKTCELPPRVGCGNSAMGRGNAPLTSNRFWVNCRFAWKGQTEGPFTLTLLLPWACVWWWASPFPMRASVPLTEALLLGSSTSNSEAVAATYRIMKHPYSLFHPALLGQGWNLPGWCILCSDRCFSNRTPRSSQEAGRDQGGSSEVSAPSMCKALTTIPPVPP